MPVVETLPGLLLKHAQGRPQEIAMRWKRYGIWAEISWGKYAINSKRVALGLDRLGVKKGQVVAFICRNRPEWIYFEMGALMMGILPFGIFAEIEDRQMVFHYLSISDTKIVLAEDQEQADKILDIRDRLPQLKNIIVPEFKEVAHYHDPIFMSFDDLMMLGKRELDNSPEKVDLIVNRLDPNLPALLTTTSGTTGLPKVAVLSSKNFISMAQSINQIDPVSQTQNYVSRLTTAWTGERMMSLGWALVSGFIVNFPESPGTIGRDLREIAPVVLFAPPRTWEGIQAEIEIGMNDTSALKHKIYRWLMPLATKAEEKGLKRISISWKDRFIRLLAEIMILRKLRDYFGLSNLLYAYTGGAALGQDVVLFFRALGINIKQIYGQSEASGIAFVHRNNDVKLETVGKPLKGIEVDIADSGEIRLKGDPIFIGYYNNQQATADVLKDGHLYTGDYGYIDQDGHLVVIDRLKEMMTTSEGTRFSPQYIETKMKFSPYIREAVAFGNHRPFIVVLIQIDMQVVGNWAERRNLAYTTFSDLVRKEEVHELIGNEFRRINKTITEQMRPRKFALLTKELDPELGDITYTQKIKRDNVMERNKDLVNSLYE